MPSARFWPAERIAASGVLSSWVTPVTNSICCRARRCARCAEATSTSAVAPSSASTPKPVARLRRSTDATAASNEPPRCRATSSQGLSSSGGCRGSPAREGSSLGGGGPKSAPSGSGTATAARERELDVPGPLVSRERIRLARVEHRPVGAAQDGEHERARRGRAEVRLGEPRHQPVPQVRLVELHHHEPVDAGAEPASGRPSPRTRRTGAARARAASRAGLRAASESRRPPRSRAARAARPGPAAPPATGSGGRRRRRGASRRARPGRGLSRVASSSPLTRPAFSRSCKASSRSIRNDCRSAGGGPRSAKNAIAARASSRSSASAKRRAERWSSAWRRSAAARPISCVQRYCRTPSTPTSSASTARISQGPRLRPLTAIAASLPAAAARFARARADVYIPYTEIAAS